MILQFLFVLCLVSSVNRVADSSFLTDGGSRFLLRSLMLKSLSQELLAHRCFDVQFFLSSVLVKSGLRKPIPSIVRCSLRHRKNHMNRTVSNAALGHAALVLS